MSPRTPGGLTVYDSSTVEAESATHYLARSDEGEKVLCVVGDTAGFEGGTGGQGDARLFPLSPKNAATLRDRLDWLRPIPLGLRTSAGFGDRLGLATPGHVRAVRGTSVAPIFAQQSVRENARTGRAPQQVMDDAMWGLFQEGWRGEWGSDADHLKTSADMDTFTAAGYTLYTVDPGDHVDNSAHTASPAELADKVQALPWGALEDTAKDLERRYVGTSFDLGDEAMELSREELGRAAAKYGHAIAHAAAMYRHLLESPPAGSVPAAERFELEVSVDETETPTSPAEHLFVASELRRLGVRWVSLAPRYVGRFEKGVDYIGDLAELEAQLARHAAIARALGPYKLSLHSGSDKFSVYPILARLAGDLVHLKTAGTSYLEALRALAGIDPGLFREILTLGLEKYEEDRATYHVSADPARLPQPDDLPDDELARVLDLFDWRELLHVTFGSALDAYRGRLLSALDSHEEDHYAVLQAHIAKHLKPFG